MPSIQQPQAFVDQILLPMAMAFDELSEASYASQQHAEQVNEHLRWLNKLLIQAFPHLFDSKCWLTF